MKELLIKGWNFMRVLRAAAGVISIYYAIDRNDAILGLAGGLFTLSAIFNIGCCSAAGCNIPGRGKNKNSKERVNER